MKGLKGARRRIEKVSLGERSYDIVIGSGVLAGAGARVRRMSGRALVVSNRRVFGLYGRRLGESLERAGVAWEAALLPDGERYKTLATAGRIYDRLARGRHDRGSAVVALGGGVIGDMAGFAAATYMRGIRLAQVPTTLLAQVDSSVGGKTGVNHPKGKNLIGAFHQPGVVLADVETLATLPREEILCGVAEIIKYGCISSARFFGYLERHMARLVALDPAVTAEAVRVSCRTKAAVVGADEREEGLRAILNFGHTVGHALEAVSGYRRWRHGHAVAMGMAAAAILSQLKGALDIKQMDRVIGLIAAAGLPAGIPRDIGERALLAAMAHDKKVRAGKIRFALLEGLGTCRIRDDVTETELREALRRCRI